MTKFNAEEEKFLERQKRLNTIHRNLMLKCNGDDSGCTTGPPCTCEFVKDDYGAPQIKICPACSGTTSTQEKSQ